MSDNSVCAHLVPQAECKRCRGALADMEAAQGVRRKRTPPTRSLTAIAQLLDCEGWTPYVAQCIRNYHRRQTELGPISSARKQKAIPSILNLPDEERAAVGRWIGCMVKEAFDAGLKLGLMSHVSGEEE
jgi:hypothetical protein